jgi:16S rRNA (adenine1518-N6/adenine1519-N6)-dimethyltransferase
MRDKSNTTQYNTTNIDGMYSKILKQFGFGYKKSLGQNFVFDTNLLSAIVQDAGITSQDTVVEIGVGAGSLTAAIASVAKRVIGYEIDRDLRAVHEIVLTQPNVELRYRDFLQESDMEMQDYKVVANLPYYITTPIIFKLLECDNPPSSIAIMVQKEVADRIVAQPNTPEYGILTISTALRCVARITRVVSRNVFVPVPNVDSAIVVMHTLDNIDTHNARHVSNLAKAAFGNRRKTLLNNLKSNYGLTRECAEQALRDTNIDARARGEILSTQQYRLLYDAIHHLKHK